MALGVEIKTFTDRDGVKHTVQGGGNAVEEYTDNEASFRDSDVIGTILVAGIHQVLYKQEGTDTETNHFLLVRYFTLTHPVTHITRYAVEQCIIDDSGIYKRTRVYNDAEHTDPYSDWNDWEELIPSVTNVITENSYNAITSGAVFALRAEGYSYVDNKLSEKMGNEMLKIELVNNGSGNMPISGNQDVEGSLDNFIAHYPHNKLSAALLHVTTQGGECLASGIVYWLYDEDDNEIEVHYLLGPVEFVAAGQANPEGTAVSTWSSNWSRTDHSQDIYS